MYLIRCKHFRCGANIPLAAGIWSSVFFIASGSLAIAGKWSLLQLKENQTYMPHCHSLCCLNCQYNLCCLLCTIWYNWRQRHSYPYCCWNRQSCSCSSQFSICSVTWWRPLDWWRIDWWLLWLGARSTTKRLVVSTLVMVTIACHWNHFSKSIKLQKYQTFQKDQP